ncbi:MAG: acyl-CoA dehydrogenase [Chloroflexota bacterium]|nr:MAG: acyl-CoA dehydrogenase [Chloroflexota bacterium]
MDFGFTEDQQRLRAEVRAFVRKEATPEVIEETYWEAGWGLKSREFLKKAGARGWLTPTWPKRYGGLESSHVEDLIIAEEMSYTGARPPGLVGASMAGPTILRFGSEEQKAEWLPRIARGEIEFALGYTEPQAGSDLAALDIRAVEDGDDFVINGMKTFNTSSHFADYHWLGARTDPDAPKHKGVSLFIVDFKSPGITIRPLWTMAGWRTNEVYYDNVRVPKKNLVGTRGRGFQQIAVALDFERMFPVGPLQRLLDELIGYVKEAKAHGKPLADGEIVRHQLAEMAAEVEVCRLFGFRLAWVLDQGRVPNYESAMAKVFQTEAMNKLTHTAMKVLGPFGQLQRSSKWVPIDGMAEYHHRWQVVETIYAGTSEIMRNIIAQRGLGLPRAQMG